MFDQTLSAHYIQYIPEMIFLVWYLEKSVPIIINHVKKYKLLLELAQLTLYSPTYEEPERLINLYKPLSVS